MRRTRAALALALAGALVLPGVVGAAPHGGYATDTKVSRQTLDKTSAVVELKGAPLATATASKPAAGKKINFRSTTVKNYRAQLQAIRNDYKAWLRTSAPKARVVGEFDISLNAVAVRLNGHTLAQIKGPQAVRAEYQALFYKAAHQDPDLALVNTVAGWNNVPGNAGKGEGVKVAILDTGIDITNPCFSDAGYSAQTQLGDRRFTNNKVIVAKVFNNKAGNRGYTPQDYNGHGSHVAGTVACNEHTPAVVQGVDIPYDMSGVAPRALLGNYNVFPALVASVRWEDLWNALEEAYEDGFDVANMSIGGPRHGVTTLVNRAVDNLDRANFIVAVAQGNSGPNAFTAEDPGAAARALTAGAITVGHFVGAPVTSGTDGPFGAAAGDFAVVTSDLTAPLAPVTTGTVNARTGLNEACAALPAGSLSGSIALISRGTCTFSTKIRNAQNAGAVAVLVVNSVAGDPTAMGGDGTANQPTVPAYMLGLLDGIALRDNAGVPTTIDSTLAYFRNPVNDSILAGFSAQGPTAVDFRVKPDAVAPGVNVLSAQPRTILNAQGQEVANCTDQHCFAFFQGTSMATPHLAGAAAVVRGQHRSWTAAQVRSAISNTADRGVVRDAATGTVVVNNVNLVGNGRLNVGNAVQADIAIDPVSVSFGAVPAGSGQTRTATVTLTNISGAPGTWSVSIADTTGTGVAFSANKSSVSLAAGASTTVTVTMVAAKGASLGGHQAWLNIGPGGSTAHAALYVFVK